MSTIDNKGLQFLLITLAALLITSVAWAGEEKSASMSVKQQNLLMESMVGEWEGTAKTWFRPGELADESPVQGKVELILGGRFMRHSYNGEMQGKPRQGEDTVAFNSATGKYQSSWVDDFHMNYGLLISEGDPLAKGFSVFGQYAVGDGSPDWGWRTVYQLEDANHLTVTAYNVTPEGEEAKAVETRYLRLQTSTKE